MNRVPVHSTDIALVGYDPATQTLEVEFKNGSVYHYTEVPPEEHAGLMAAESKGRYHTIHIRGIYDYRKL